MTESEVRNLLVMIADPDADPDTFHFVLRRIIGLIYGAESSRAGNSEDR